MSTAVAMPTSRAAGGQRHVWLWLAVGLLAALGVFALGYFLAGPRPETLPVAYGKRRGAEGAKSVGGTAVLAEMFKAAGHRVTTLTRFSPKLDGYDVIVWVPNDYEPPTKEQREFLENWLAGGWRRTLVYVGRDYDAATDYWQQVRPNAHPEIADEVQRQLARAKAENANRRAKMPAQQYARWFTARRDGMRRTKVDSLAGPWADGIDAKQVALRLEGRLDIPAPGDVGSGDPLIPQDFVTLLSADGDPLAVKVSDVTWGESTVIVLANGSFVLNYPLVNHEHRKLAARLIGECGSPPRKVAFIESEPGGPPVLDKEPTGENSILAFLTVWPLNAIVLQLTVLGIVFCLARSPIFGRPRELPAEPAADFGKHVGALGELLARTGDRQYAQSRLAQYRQIGKRDSGKSHLKGS